MKPQRKRLAARIVAAALTLAGFGLLIGTILWYVVWHPELTSAEMLRATWHVLVLGTMAMLIGMVLGEVSKG